MSEQARIFTHTGIDRLLETTEIHRISPEFDVLLVYPTEDGREIPDLKIAASRDSGEVGPLLAPNYAVVLAGPLPESYLRSPALMERVRFLDRPYDHENRGRDNSRHVIWSCPYPGIVAEPAPQAHGAAL